MQRTIKHTRFTYAINEIGANGEVATRLDTVEVAEANEARALKKAQKIIGVFVPLRTEVLEKLYVLDDETFMKYATVKE